MIEKLKNEWQQFKHDEPGKRFQNSYHRRQEESQGRLSGMKLFNILGGLVIVVAGLALVPLPGPGSAIIIVGLGMLGSEFLPVARFLDATEFKVRAAVQESKAFWAKSSGGVKAIISLIALSCLAGAGYGIYDFFFVPESK